MSHIAVDTNLPDCAETMELEETLGVEEAWRHLFYLWCWAFEADFQNGVVKLTPKLLARSARWFGDQNKFFDALCRPLGPNKLAWLVNRGKGYYYLRGWSRNKQFFIKKQQGRQRQQRYRDKANAKRNALHDSNGDRDVYPDRSRSPSRSPSRSLSSDPETQKRTLWSPGDPIRHVAQWERASAELGISIQPTPSERATAHRVITAGPIESFEYANARQKGKGKGAAYFFAIIEGERRTAAEQSNRSSPSPTERPRGRGWTENALDDEKDAAK